MQIIVNLNLEKYNGEATLGPGPRLRQAELYIK